MKVLKKTLSLVLVLSFLLSLSVLPAHAAGATISLSTVNAEAGKATTMDLTIADNPGVGSLTVYVYYDSNALTCSEASTTGIVWTGVLPESSPDNARADKDAAHADAKWKVATFTYINSEASTENGKIGSLVFTPKADLESCSSAVDVQVTELIDGSGNDITNQAIVKSGIVEIKGAIPTIKTVAIDKPTLEVNGTTGGTAQMTATSAKNTDITGSVTWSVSPSTGGVSVNERGVVTVDAKAKADTYTIKADGKSGTSQGTGSATLTVTRATPVVQSIAIYQGATKLGGSATIIIPTSGTNTYAYSVKSTDQYGDETAVTNPAWTFTTADSGVTFTNGTVTVNTTATEGKTYTLNAEAGGKSASVTLTVRDIEVKWPTVTIKQNPTYGDTWAQIVTLSNNGSANLNGTNVPGTFTLEGTTANSPAAGEQTYIIRFKSTDNQYDVTTTGTVEIAKKLLTVLPGDFSVAKEYDGDENVPATAIISGSLGLSGKIGNDDVSLAPVTRENLGKYSGINISNNLTLPVTVSLIGTAANNYTVVSPYNFPNARITKTLPKLENFTVTVPDAFTYDSKTAGTAKIEVNAGVSGMGAVTVMYAKQNANGTYDTPVATAPVNAGTYKVVARIAEGANFAYLNELDTTKTFTINKAARTLTVKNSPLTLLPNAKTAALELEYPDLDNSAKVTYELTDDTTAVSRNGNSFTAVGNGVVDVTVKIAETDNYNAATDATATINAIVNPVASVAATSSAVGDVVTASLSGSTITVSGMMESVDALTVTVTPADITGVTLNAAVSGDKVEIKLGDGTVVATYTIDKANIVTKPANMEISETPTVEGTDIAGSETDGAAASTAGALIDEAKKWETENQTGLTEKFAGTPYTVEIQVDVAIKQKDYVSNQKLSVNITPTYKIIAYETGNKSNAYYDEAPSGIEIPQRAIKSPITIKVKLPTGFVPDYAKHTKGDVFVEYLAVTVQSGFAVWQQSSFSDVELGISDKVTITYPLSADAEQTVEHSQLNLTTPTPSGSGTFNGWTYTQKGTENKIGPVKTLTEEQLKTLKSWGEGNIEVTSGGFSRPSSGGGGGGGTYVPSGTYPVNITKRPSNGTVSTSPSHAKKGDTVTLTVKPNTGYVLDTLTVKDKDGNSIRLREQETNVYTFTMPDSAVSVEATFKAAETGPVNPFRDVSNSAYYYDAVMWAVENGVTGGTTATTFSPNNACTRAQTVTFLWRAAGSPAPASRNNPFTDVVPGAYYYDAVLWAVEKGITTGVTATTFGPNTTVNRGQVVTFLSRSAKAAPVNGANPFTDVPANAYYANAVLWAVENGITNGTTATTFSPAAPCTRGQIVTFLYRYFV